MSRLTASRLVHGLGTAAIAALLLAAGATGAAAAPYKPICGGGLCMHKDTASYTNNRTYFYFTFKGSAITHYNVRYVESGGRTVQGEVGTRPGSNKSIEKSLKTVPGSQYSVSVQACVRGAKLPILAIQVAKSSCTAWRKVTFYAPS